jgi:hypothetical protein
MAVTLNSPNMVSASIVAPLPFQVRAVGYIAPQDTGKSRGVRRDGAITLS